MDRIHVKKASHRATYYCSASRLAHRRCAMYPPPHGMSWHTVSSYVCVVMDMHFPIPFSFLVRRPQQAGRQRGQLRGIQPELRLRVPPPPPPPPHHHQLQHRHTHSSSERSQQPLLQTEGGYLTFYFIHHESQLGGAGAGDLVRLAVARQLLRLFSCAPPAAHEDIDIVRTTEHVPRRRRRHFLLSLSCPSCLDAGVVCVRGCAGAAAGRRLFLVVVVVVERTWAPGG
ncbi:hypothetical protein BC826DRAFT_992132 [Russula brevipes]|nr:hypothetical protein BC826DRAFT_992132 [Russula brevipes]